MNLSDIVTFVITFTDKWMGTTVPRVLAAFMGILLCVLSGAGLWEKRIKTLTGIFVAAVGLTMLAVALNPKLMYMFATSNGFTRIRVLMGLLSFVVLVITIEAIRRSHLRERYALLWVVTGLIILLAAFFPNILEFIRIILGAQYVTVVSGIVFAFLLLIAFHFSISLSGFLKSQSQIAQRCAILEQRVEELKLQLEKLDPEAERISLPAGTAVDQIIPECTVQNAALPPAPRRVRGSQIMAPLIVFAVFVSVVAVGAIARQPMVGDEVTHFSVLEKQAKNLSKPNFEAKIPTGWDSGGHKGSYPLPFLWHYIGAIVYRLSSGSVLALQLYQSLFLVQLLWVAYLLARSRGGVRTRAAALYLISLASLPVSLMYSVTFHLAVPMTAQVLTAFYLLKKRRFYWASVFMCFAVGIKISALLFVPAFFSIMWFQSVKSENRIHASVTAGACMLMVACFTFAMGGIIKAHTGATFYQHQKIGQAVSSFHPSAKTGETKNEEPRANYEKQRPENYPGHLGLPRNYLIYGGIVLWAVVLAGAFSTVRLRFGNTCSHPGIDSGLWLWCAGLSYGLLAVCLTRFVPGLIPEARFFFPALPFLLLPIVEKVACFRRIKWFIAGFTALAILQSGFVLATTYRLRTVPVEVIDAIGYLRTHPPEPARIFIYPQGNDRLFPIPHDGQPDGGLEAFLRAGNNVRLETLQQSKIGAVVIKKDLMGQTKRKIFDPSVYPAKFVRDIAGDGRFEKVYENSGVAVYRVPPPDAFGSGNDMQGN